MPTKAELENQISELQRIDQELQRINHKLQRINQKLEEEIPERISKLIEESNAFSQCIAEIEKGKTDVEMTVSDANTAGEKNIDALEAKSEKFAKIHQQREDESVEKIGDLTEDFKKLAGKT